MQKHSVGTHECWNDEQWDLFVRKDDDYLLDILYISCIKSPRGKIREQVIQILTMIILIVFRFFWDTL